MINQQVSSYTLPNNVHIETPTQTINDDLLTLEQPNESQIKIRIGILLFIEFAINLSITIMEGFALFSNAILSFIHMVSFFIMSKDSAAYRSAVYINIIYK